MAVKQPQNRNQATRGKTAEDAGTEKPGSGAQRESQPGAVSQTSVFRREKADSAAKATASAGQQGDEKEASPQPEGVAEEAGQSAPKEGEAPSPAGRKRVVLPSAQQPARRIPFATHRPAPESEEQENAELQTFGANAAEKEYSTGFILGVALIVISLIAGIFIVRLHKKVNRLETRLARLEKAVADSPFSSWALH